MTEPTPSPSVHDSDDGALPELTRRQEDILSLIVRTYTQQPEPVSSKGLVEKYDLTFSSATVRNEMAQLEELGYIGAPHTSAGRVPTEKGYRYFVQRLIREGELSSAEETTIARKLQAPPLATEQWLRLAASLLARTAHGAALVTPPVAADNRFKHVELIAIQGRLALMVLVLQQGAVYQQMLTLADPVPQPRLAEAAARINAQCDGAAAIEVRVRAGQQGLLEREVLEIIADTMERSAAQSIRLVYSEGLSDIIPAFAHNEGAQQAVRVFEERSFLTLVLDEVLTPRIGDVQVVIAGNGKWDDLRYLTLVLSRYGIPGQASGAIGVLGPTHINYGRAIRSVQFVSGVMTDMLVEAWHTNDPALPPPEDGS